MVAQTSGLGAQVLVLNKMWVAIRVIDARRAFSMLFSSHAEAIHVDDGSYSCHDFESWADLSTARDQFSEHHDWVQTVRMTIVVPKVIRLLGYERRPQRAIKLNRRNIFARDRNSCQYCGHHYPTSELSLDHVIPRSQGGGSSWANLVCCCVKCNSKKGGRTPVQAHMKLVTKPVKPTRHPAITIRLGSDKYASWKQFLDNAYWSVELQ